MMATTTQAAILGHSEAETANRDDHRAPVLAEQLYLNAKNLIGGSIVHVALGLLVCAVMMTSFAPVPLVEWTAAIVATAALRSGLSWRFTRRADHSSPAALRQGRLLLVGTALAVGSAWGVLPVLFFQAADPQYEIFIVFVLGGMALGALPVSAYYLPSYYGLYLPALAPLIVIYATADGPVNQGMAVFLAVFCIALALFARRFNSTVTRLLKLQVMRDGLLKSLQNAREILSAALTSRSDGFAIFDPDDRLALWNDKFAAGIEPHAGKLAVGRSFESLVRTAARARRTLRTGEFDSAWAERRLRLHRDPGPPFEQHIDGRWLLVQEYKTPDGSTVIVHTDITELKAREHALMDSETQKASIVSAALDGVVTVDTNGTILEFNEAAQAMFGWSAAELVGANVTETLLAPVNRDFLRGELENFRRTGTSALIGRRTEMNGMRRDGSLFPAEVSVVQAHTAKGMLITGFVRDISARLEAERRLKAARDEAQAASRAKSDFLATISHEIRTPMNGVLGAIDLLMNSPLAPDQARLASAARSAGESLRVLLDDLLDYSKIEAGKLEMDIAPFAPAELLNDVAEMFQAQAAAKGIALAVEVMDDVPDRVGGDAARLRQILINLVGNAVKFTAEGGVTVCAENAVARCGSAVLRFEVRDTGVGIAPEFKSRIFSKFSQADPTISRRHGGSGLGLAIVKGLTELMGGTVDYKSRPGEGSRFWIDIPFKHAEQQVPGPASAAAERDSLEGCRLLLVDDSDTNRLVTSEMLARAGAQVEEASSGPAALRAAAEQRFDAVLMDVSMPDMDGIETTRRLWASGLSDLPVIALTAHAGSEDKARFLDLGFSAYLAKPVRPETLVGTVAACLGRETLPASGGGGAPPAADRADPREPLDAGVLSVLRTEVGDTAFLRLLDAFLHEAETRTEEIDRAIAASDYPALEVTAHALKSAAGTFGALKLAETAELLEEAGQERLEAVAQAVHPLFVQALDHAVAALREARAEMPPAA